MNAIPLLRRSLIIPLVIGLVGFAAFALRSPSPVPGHDVRSGARERLTQPMAAVIPPPIEAIPTTVAREAQSAYLDPEAVSTTTAPLAAARSADLDKLPTGEQASLSQALSEARRTVTALTESEAALPYNAGVRLFAQNPSQKLTARFLDQSVRIESGHVGPDWQATFHMTGLPAATGVVNAGTRVEYQRGPVTEWYDNRPDGIEQGFIVARPLQSEGDLRLIVTVDGLTAEPNSGDPSAFTLSDASQVARLSYDKLLAWDATGKTLPSRMEAGPHGIALIVDDAGARYPITIDPLIASLEQKLGPDVTGFGESGENFGSAAALDGDTLVVGAPGDQTPSGTNAGSCYIFLRSGPTWNLQAKMVAPDGASYDQFGRAVSLSGDTAVVGAQDGGHLGGVYVFARNGTSWTQQAKLVAADAEVGDYFGVSVSVSGDTVVAGSSRDGIGSGSRNGSAYVFTRSGSAWSQQAKLIANDAASNDFLGYSVAVAGDTAVLGATGDDSGGKSSSGSAYVFTRSGSNWTQQGILVASDGQSADQLGTSVALSGDTIVVGAEWDDMETQSDVGSAYVFIRNGTTWSQQAKLVASDGLDTDNFGRSVSLSGNTVVVGSWRDDSAAGSNSGSAYVFVRNGTAWSQQSKLFASDAADSDQLGYSVAVSGETVLVGIPGDNSEVGPDTGSALIFTRIGTTWNQQAQIFAGDSGTRHAFGRSIAIDENTLVVGASDDPTASARQAGSIYIFIRSGAVWSLQAKVISPDISDLGRFGTSVSILGNTIAVCGNGSTYVFTRSGTIWSQQAKLSVAGSGLHSVSLSGDTVVAGARGDGSPAGANAGSAYVFIRSGTTWSQQAKLVAADQSANDEFGGSVAISGNTVIVGAWQYWSQGAGKAYIFTRNGVVWSQQAQLTSPEPGWVGRFGQSVALSGDSALVGAQEQGMTGPSYAGGAYVFVRNGNLWNLQTRLTANDAAASDSFGYSVALSGDTAVIGAVGDDNNAGSAYVFNRTGTAWSQQSKCVASERMALDWFGEATALSGDTVVVGAWRDDGPGYPGDPAVDQGSVHIFRLSSSEIPEIAVEQPPSSNLPNGGIRDFGIVALGGDSSLTFTIKNTDSGDLNLTGTPKVAVTGSNDFAVTAQPLSPIAGPDGSTTFTVRFSPTTAGLKNATIHIASNDADENPYDINLTGATTAPGITVQPSGSSIYEGETASLSVSASGAQPLVYQWYAGPSGNTANPVGGDSATLTTGNLFATTSFWVRVSNSFGSVDSAAATITLLPSKPTITSVSAAYGRQSTPFSHQITATQNPTSYGAVGLPSGLSLNASTGLISGFPLVSGTFAVTLSAQNGLGTGQQVFNLQIYPPFTSVITSPLFAAATATVPFSSQLTATHPWITFEIQNGPAWLSVNPNTGLLSGTPIVPGTVTVQVRATSSGQSAWSTLSIAVSPHPDAPVITSLAETSGRRLESLSFQITATPAATSYEVAGVLPSGIVLNPSSGLISGMPTVEGTFHVTITASNASGLSLATPFTIVLWPARLVPVITSATSFVVNIGTSFSTTVLATNSPSVFTFENLPPGLLQAGTSGLISGPLTTAGTFAFSVKASNGNGSGPTQNMVLRVQYNAAAPAVIASSVPSCFAGLPFSFSIPVSVPATLFTAVGLPPGLTLNPATGVISGTPAANGSFDVTLQASNAAGMGEPRVLTITIAPTPDAPEIIGSLLEETTALSSFTYAIQTNSVLPITSYTVSGLPDGITANSISGLISGAATLTGVFDVKIKAASAVGASAEKVMRLTVRAGSLVPKITSSASEAVQQGASFSYQITASNPPILAWQTSTLPTGLALNSTTGAITGKPLVPGIYQVALRASNVNGAGDIQMLQIQVKPNAAVPVMLVPIKVWFDGANPINMQLEATNLPTSKPWESGIGIFATNLPSGMTLNSATGVLSGHSPSSFSGISIGFYGVNSTGRGPNKVITFRDYDNKANQPVITGPFQLSATRGMNLSFTTTVDRPASSFDVIWSGPNGSGQMSGASPNFLIPASNLPLPGISIYSLGAYNGAFGDRGGLSMSVASASGAPTIQSPSEIYCTAGAPISASLAASGTPTRFEISAMSPAWPSGLSFNNNTGTFSGTVSQTGVISFLARAYNAVGASLTKEITMVFSPPAGAPTITTGEALASVSSLETEEMEPMSDPLSPLYGQVGVAFIHQFQATGNVIRFGITGLPEGLVYNENTGEVSGEPVEPGHFDLIVTPIGSTISGQPVTFALWIEAAAGTPEITSPAAAAAVAGTAFTWQFTASATPVGYNLAELPDWLNFDPFTGSLSGIPSVPGDTKLQISGFNALGEGLTQEFTIYATAAAGTPVVNPPAGSFPGQVGVAFNASISAAGTVNFYDASALPFGISLNAQTGVFSGIPVESGTHVVQVWGVNAQGIGESRAVTFTISPAVGTPAFNGDTNLRAIAGQAFAHAFTTVPAATAFAANGLPSGWSFDPVSGLLQAATPLAGDFNLEIEAWNAAGSSGNQLFQVRVFADAKELWQDEKFGDQADNPAVGGWTADPDRDSVSNLLEYAFGLNPNSGASLQFPPAQRVGGNFIISFIQPAGVTGITYGAEWSPTMNVGTWLPVPDTGSGGVHTFSVPIGSHTKMFIRLTVTN